jgi:hypothetical protein
VDVAHRNKHKPVSTAITLERQRPTRRGEPKLTFMLVSHIPTLDRDQALLNSSPLRIPSFQNDLCYLSRRYDEQQILSINMAPSGFASIDVEDMKWQATFVALWHINQSPNSSNINSSLHTEGLAKEG